MKFSLENRIFLKKGFEPQIRAHLKRINWKTSIWCGSDEKVSRMWLKQGNDVARTPPLLYTLSPSSDFLILLITKGMVIFFGAASWKFFLLKSFNLNS